MADTTMIPFDAGHDGLEAGLGGAVGAFLGSWFMNGWGGGGWGGWGGRGFGPGYGDSAAGVVAASDRAVADSVIMDSLSHVSDQVSGVNTAILSSQAQQNSAMCQGFSGVNNSVFQSAAGLSRDMGTGFNAISRDVTSGNAGINQNLCSGFANTIAALNANGAAARYDTMSGFNQTQRAIDACCCNTQTALANGFGHLALENCQNTGAITGAILADGGQTRALINQNYINELQTKLCDAKAKIGSLENQQFTQTALTAQSVVFDQKLANAINTIVAEIKGSTTTPTA